MQANVSVNYKELAPGCLQKKIDYFTLVIIATYFKHTYVLFSVVIDSSICKKKQTGRLVSYNDWYNFNWDSV